jgi:putative holliday junction resolvase
MHPMRALGLDLGNTRIGVAISDELAMMAHPRPHLLRKPWPEFLRALDALIQSEGVTDLVVGLPLDMKGEEGDAALNVRRIARELKGRTKCSMHLWDERLSTVQAKRALHAQGMNAKKQKGHIDSASAVIVLQAWLDAR